VKSHSHVGHDHTGPPICDHRSAGGSFIYRGEGPGALRECTVCHYTEECYCPDPEDKPQYIQWRPYGQWGIMDNPALKKVPPGKVTPEYKRVVKMERHPKYD